MWTHFLFFTFSKLKFSKFGNVNTLSAQLIVPSKPNVCNLFDFPSTKSTQKKYFPHISYEICEINSIKINASRAFQQHQEHPQIPIQFLVPILLNFHWENGSIINRFHIVVPNNLKQSQYTPTHWELSKDTKSVAWSTMVWEILAWQNKTKCFAS